MRILMVGAGATGGYFGGRLLQAGRDVTFLLREGRAKQIREQGLEIVSPSGDVRLHPRVVTAAELEQTEEAFDLAILSVKSYQLESAITDMAPAVGNGAMVLPVLNGMRHLSTLDDRFGAEKVIGGTIRIFSELDSRGRVHHMSGLAKFSYGERSGERSPRIEALDGVMHVAGFDAKLEADIVAALWQKWWILASLGSICTLARGTAGQASGAPYGKEFARAVIEECTEIASANGYPPDEAMLAYHIGCVTEEGSPLTSSMYRDMRKGAAVEADHILGDLLRRARGVRAPLLTAAYVQLKVYEAGRPD